SAGQIDVPVGRGGGMQVIPEADAAVRDRERVPERIAAVLGDVEADVVTLLRATGDSRADRYGDLLPRAAGVPGDTVASLEHAWAVRSATHARRAVVGALTAARAEDVDLGDPHVVCGADVGLGHVRGVPEALPAARARGRWRCEGAHAGNEHEER